MTNGIDGNKCTLLTQRIEVATVTDSMEVIPSKSFVSQFVFSPHTKTKYIEIYINYVFSIPGAHGVECRNRTQKIAKKERIEHKHYPLNPYSELK